MRVALVHDWLDTWGGGENVLVEFLRLFPKADVYTLVDFLSPADRARLPDVRIRTSVLQHLPRRAARLPLRRGAVAAGDRAIRPVGVRPRRVGFARGRQGRAHAARADPRLLLPHARAFRLDDVRDLSRARPPARAGWTRPLVDRALARFRAWDRDAAARVDRFVANSKYIAGTIRRAWGRDADVVYPPVDVERFAAAALGGDRDPRRSPYVTVSRLVPYKRIDVIVDAFRELPDRRLVVVGDGPERARLAAALPPNVTLAGRLDDDATVAQVAAATAFLIAAEEDFGIAPVEAQAAGTPVIAYGRGGALETVRGLDHARPTGLVLRRADPGRARRRRPPVRSRARPDRPRRLPRARPRIRARALPRRVRGRRRRHAGAPHRRRAGADDRLTMQRNLLKDNSTLLDTALRVVDPLFVVAAGVAAYYFYFDTLDLPAHYVAALLAVALFALVVFPSVQALPVAARNELRRGAARALPRLARDRGHRRRVPVPRQDGAPSSRARGRCCGCWAASQPTSRGAARCATRSARSGGRGSTCATS